MPHLLRPLLIIMVMLPMSLNLDSAERSHPYLFFTRQDIPVIQTRLKDPTLRAIYDRVCRRALDYDIPGRKILCAGIAYQISGEKQYAEAGIEEMMRHLKQGSWFSGGVAVYHCDLNTAKKTLPLAYGWDMFYDAMSESQREEIKTAVDRHVFKPYLEAHANHNKAGGFFTDSQGRKTYWTQAYFNWNHWINGDIGLMGLAMLDEHPQARAVVEAARASLRYTHAEHRQGERECGGWDEGTMYWGTAMAHSIGFYAALEKVLGTDDGYFDLPGIKMTSQFALDFTGPDGKWIPFSDCNHRDVIDPLSQVYYLAQKYRRTLDMAYPECYVDDHHALPFAVIWRPPGKTVPLPPKRKICWYKDIHWAVLKNGPTELAFKGGDLACNHGQFDLNSMVVYVNNDLVLSDPGYGVKDTKDHNTLLLNNNGQQKRSNGSNRENGGYSDAVAEIEMCTELENGDLYLVSNASDCYNGLKLFRRHVVLTTTGIVVVFDEIVAAQASNMILSWHPEQSVNATDKGAILSGTRSTLQLAVHADQKFSVSTSGKSLRLESNGRIPSLRSVCVMVPEYKKSFEIDADYSGNSVEISCLNKSYIFKMTKNGYQLDADAKVEKRKSGKADKPDRKKERVTARPRTKQTLHVDDKTLIAWNTKMKSTLQALLRQGKKPYMLFMNKEYQVMALSDSGTMSIQSGLQKISYPYKNLKIKDRASLACGMQELGGATEGMLAVFYLRLNNDEKAAASIYATLGKAEREELDAVFEQ